MNPRIEYETTMDEKNRIPIPREIYNNERVAILRCKNGYSLLLTPEQAASTTGGRRRNIITEKRLDKGRLYLEDNVAESLDFKPRDKIGFFRVLGLVGMVKQ